MINMAPATQRALNECSFCPLLGVGVGGEEPPCRERALWGLTHREKKAVHGAENMETDILQLLPLLCLRKLQSVSGRGCPKTIKEANLFAKGGNSTG